MAANDACVTLGTGPSASKPSLRAGCCCTRGGQHGASIGCARRSVKALPCMPRTTGRQKSLTHLLLWVEFCEDKLDCSTGGRPTMAPIAMGRRATPGEGAKRRGNRVRGGIAASGNWRRRCHDPRRRLLTCRRQSSNTPEAVRAAWNRAVGLPRLCRNMTSAPLRTLRVLVTNAWRC